MRFLLQSLIKKIRKFALFKYNKGNRILLQKWPRYSLYGIHLTNRFLQKGPSLKSDTY